MFDVIAQLVSNLLLQPLDCFRVELDHLARVQINQMIVVLTIGIFKTRRSAFKSVAVHRTQFFQQLHGPVNSRK